MERIAESAVRERQGDANIVNKSMMQPGPWRWGVGLNCMSAMWFDLHPL
jgi:hypothetical protein